MFDLYDLTPELNCIFSGVKTPCPCLDYMGVYRDKRRPTGHKLRIPLGDVSQHECYMHEARPDVQNLLKSRERISEGISHDPLQIPCVVSQYMCIHFTQDVHPRFMRETQLYPPDAGWDCFYITPTWDQLSALQLTMPCAYIKSCYV